MCSACVASNPILVVSIIYIFSEHNKKQRFGKTKSTIRERKLKIRVELNCSIFFKRFCRDLDEKITSAGYKRERNGKQHDSSQAVNLLRWSLSMDNLSLTRQQLFPHYFLNPYKCPDFHPRKILPHFEQINISRGPINHVTPRQVTRRSKSAVFVLDSDSIVTVTHGRTHAL